uniref:C2H2-type domain-containing protein n=1 Tax=Panagrellus redivivus TaxID=6233 RepID=A0A7E4VP46_PANRE
MKSDPSRYDVQFASAMVQLAIVALVVSTDPLTRPRLLIKGSRYRPIAIPQPALEPPFLMKDDKRCKMCEAEVRPNAFRLRASLANAKKCAKVLSDIVEDRRFNVGTSCRHPERHQHNCCRFYRRASLWSPRNKSRCHQGHDIDDDPKRIPSPNRRRNVFRKYRHC